jgi:hypothetical protein
LLHPRCRRVRVSAGGRRLPPRGRPSGRQRARRRPPWPTPDRRAASTGPWRAARPGLGHVGECASLTCSVEWAAGLEPAQLLRLVFRAPTAFCPAGRGDWG